MEKRVEGLWFSDAGRLWQVKHLEDVDREWWVIERERESKGLVPAILVFRAFMGLQMTCEK